MAVDRVQIVHSAFRKFVASWKRDVASGDGPELPFDRNTAIEIFESQLLSRHLDMEARRLRSENAGFYTIGSAGHEGNAILGRLLRVDDPAFLHYRSGAFVLERARKAGYETMPYDILLGVCASRSDPISGGRHKVFGSQPLWIPPQTSTIASHLPKAVGAALAIPRAKRLGLSLPIPEDAIICCTFGDASVNHSVATGAFNAAQWAAFQRLPLPILFVCEDNGIGISVRTPPGWIQSNFENRQGLHYITANGLDLTESFEPISRAVRLCREERIPVFLHVRTVRLFGHAGSDVESEYMTKAEQEAIEALDPIRQTAQRLLESGLLSADEILSLDDACHKRAQRDGERAKSQPKLASADEIIEPLAPFSAGKVKSEAARTSYDVFVPHDDKPRHLAVHMNWVLADMLRKYPEMIVFGEDVAKKGGVYHVTTGLNEQFGSGRVFNTLLDETTILGLAIGAAHLGFLPVPEIQYLAYFHNAEDQVRGEAGSLQFFSNNQYRNPMVVRIASFGYQKGFGGHFHNDNSIGALRDIPGVVIAAPSRGDDASGMFRTAMALAKVDGRVVFFLEPIALYMQKDLFTAGDGKWSFPFQEAGHEVPFGTTRTYHPKHRDLTIFSYANGLYLSLRAAQTLKAKHNIAVRVVDLRWLHPLPEKEILEEARMTPAVLVVDECRASGGVADSIVRILCTGDTPYKGRISFLTAFDSYQPLGPAAQYLLPTEEKIEAEVKRLLSKK